MHEPCLIRASVARVSRIPGAESSGFVLAFAVALLITQFAPAARAADWPNKSVRIVVPYVPGGSADLLGRLMAVKLGESLNQTFVIENRGGVAGVVGSELVAQASRDGYTLLVSGIGSHVHAPAMRKVPYDPLRDFSHIALLGGPPGVIVVNSNFPARDLNGLIAAARSQSLSYGSAGAGTHGHLTAELFKMNARIDMTHIPYKGAGQAIIDLLGGHIPVAIATLVAAAPQMRAGALRALAVSSERRVKSFPDVPTFAELGYPDIVTITWFGLAGPQKIPQAIVKRLNSEVRKAMQAPDVRERFAAESIEPNDLDPAQVTEFVRSEIKRWQPVVKAAGVKLD
jgi:tripartite-type tricarboxylate transporter receptor subunit TctC